jgi:murein DD-endopeptidase MepM/ murein hydrolase activator NlpD
MRHSRRQFVGLMASTPLAIFLGGCLGSDRPEARVTVDGGTPAPTRAPGATAAAASATKVPFVPTPPPSELDADDLHGFVMPIENACLPGNDNLMPNAAREYRSGVHEGIDFYFGDSCVVIERGTPVVAAFGGVVIRADHDYVDLTLEQANALAKKTDEQGFSDDETLDVYRGRQLWIDHGNGIVTRSCHLHRIQPDLAEGLLVEQGQVIGSVGESGTPESVTAPGTELHLHWEVRIGEGFLGQDAGPDEVRSSYRRLFEPL